MPAIALCRIRRILRNTLASCSITVGIPAEFQRFWPYSSGRNPSRDAFTMYAPAGSASNSNTPSEFARTVFPEPGVPPIGSNLTAARARGLPVRFSTTTPRMTAACRKPAGTRVSRGAITYLSMRYNDMTHRPSQTRRTNDDHIVSSVRPDYLILDGYLFGVVDHECV